MKPKNTYISHRTINFGTKSLFLLLLTLISVFFAKNTLIKVPHFLSNHLTNFFWKSSELTIGYQDLRFAIDGTILFSKLKVSDLNGTQLIVKKGRINLNPFSFLSAKEYLLKSLQFDNISFFSNFTETQLKISNLKSSIVKNNQCYYEIGADFLNQSLKAKGILSLPLEIKEQKRKPPSLSQILTKISRETRKVFHYFQQVMVKNLFTKVEIDNRMTSFARIDTKPKSIQATKLNLLSSSCLVEISNDFQDSIARISLGDISCNLDNQLIKTSNLLAKIRLNDFSSNSILLSFKKVECSGKVEGILEPFDLRIQKKNGRSNIMLFSSTKTFNSSLNYEKIAGKESIRGFLKLKPNAFQLACIKNGKKLKIVGGDSLDINFNENYARNDESFLTLFSVNAGDFSILESPKGNYFLEGELKNDLAVEIRNAYGMMGRSVVNGSYTQKWVPHQYEFKLKGHCYPPDLQNWLGLWWTNLCKNFSFPNEIPFGDFRISGTWGGAVGNSQTFGIINAKELLYRDFFSNQSTIVVNVDHNATRIESKNISHPFGKIESTLIFPRKHTGSLTFLNFSFDGSYPLNDARSIFGEEFSNAVKDINASSIFCSAFGQIPNPSSKKAPDIKFVAKLQSREPVKIKGIRVDNFTGQITMDTAVIEGAFPKLQIAKGFGRLNFEINSRGSEENSKIKFKLEQASKNLLFQELIHAREQGHFDIMGDQTEDFVSNERDPNDGTLSLSLQAEGPLSNPLQFEGSGMFHLKEPNIGQINLFGKISEGLSNLKIPLPTGAFSFNELIIPFNLNNETMSFDELKLGGPISKITSQGSFNLSSGTVDLIAKLSLVGNIPLPLIQNLVQFADPISRMAEIKVTGKIKKPKWELLLSGN